MEHVLPSRRSLKRDRTEILVLTGVALAHCVVVALLLISLQQSGVLPDMGHVRAMFTSNVVAPVEAVRPPTLPQTAELDVSAEVDAPSFDTAREAAAAPGVRDDPFAGAAVPKMTSKFRGMVAAPTSATFERWTNGIKSALDDAAALNASAASIAIEVFAQPSGGFTDVRLRAGTGDKLLDAKLLDGVRTQQSIISAGLVQRPDWVELPPFILGHDQPNPH